MNLAEYEARLRQLPCVVHHHMGIVCRCEELHHAGSAEERSDWAQVPLCQDMHTGANGIHGLHRRTFHMRYKLTDVQMLAITRQLYAKEFE